MKKKDKDLLKQIIKEERAIAQKDVKNKVKDWEKKYIDRLADRLEKELCPTAKADKA